MADIPVSEGETITWQGKPALFIRVGAREKAFFFVAAALVAFGLLNWTVRALLGLQDDGAGAAVGFFLAGLFCIVLPIILAIIRAKERYALTDKAAYGSHECGRKWERYAGRDWSGLRKQYSSPPSIYFAERLVSYRSQERSQMRETRQQEVGFLNIADANLVWSKMRALRNTDPIDPDATVPEGWEDILAPGENILWRGKPKMGNWGRNFKLGTAFFGGLFLAIGAVVVGLSEEGFDLDGIVGLSSIALMFLIVALGVPRLVAHAMENTWYTVTSKRVVIGTVFLLERSVQIYLASEWTLLSWGEDKPERIILRRKKHGTGDRGLDEALVTLSGLQEAKEVFEIMQGVKYPGIAEQRQTV